MDVDDEVGTGLFPHGPSQQIVRDREKIIKKLIKALTRARNASGIDKEYIRALYLVLGEPDKCLICEKPKINAREPNDLDTWFCSLHCPICAGNWYSVLR